MTSTEILQVTLPLFGAAVIVVAILQTRTVFQALEFVQEPPREQLLQSLRNYRGVMYFFLFGNLMISGAFASGWEGRAPTLLGLIFVLASVFVLYSIFLQQAMVREIMRTLQVLVPMCSTCKRIRKADGDPFEEEDWVNVDSYISRRTGAQVTHGICPTCVTEVYGDVSGDWPAAGAFAKGDGERP